MARAKKQECPEGAPGWIVTFSDLMSLLLTFFVLLLSFSTISEQEFNEAMMSLQGALGILPKFSHVISVAPRPPRRPTDDTAKAARRLRRQMQLMAKDKQVKIQYDALGGIKISLPSAVLFDSGNAVLKADAYPVLQSVGDTLRDLPDTFIEVRGHTDGQALTTSLEYRDNYVLSYFRADAVARQLNVASGVPMEQFELIACGPNQPMATNDTLEGRRANRRVEIFVRGLVDKKKLQPLFDTVDQYDTFEPPEYLPVSPRELNDLR